MSIEATVYIVEDDDGMRKSVEMLVRSVNLNAQSFTCADDFLKAFDATQCSCLVLDLRMPKMSGSQLQEFLTAKNIPIPIIFVSAYAEVATAVRAMKLGCFDFIEKPYSSQLLVERIFKALEQDKLRRTNASQSEDARAKIRELTAREKEVLRHVVLGKPSKAIASELAVSVSTVDNHRARVMKKLHAETSADLTRIALTAEPNFLSAPLDTTRLRPTR